MAYTPNGRPGANSSVVEGIVTIIKRALVIWPSLFSVLLASLMLLKLSQVSDLLARPFGVRDYGLLIVSLLLFWLVPVHLGARILLDRAQPSPPSGPHAWQASLDIWLPRFLPLVAILVLFVSIYRQMHDYAALARELPTVTAMQGIELQLYGIPVVVLFLFVGYLLARERTKGKLSGWWLVIYSILSIGLVVAAGVLPLEFAERFSGLLYFPMMAGSWIMPLVGLIVLSRQDNYKRWVQFGSAFLASALVVVTWFTDNQFHDIRVLEPKEVKATGKAQFTLKDFIDEWRTKNNCVHLEKVEHRRCQAILVTAEGGASRAAFQVATVLGDLLDKWPTEDFRNKLFLFSGVSGGSFGLATARQALADSTGRKPPCKNYSGAESRNWIYGGTSDASKAGTSWRKCLQLLVSGDYLTPAMVGLTLRDWWMGLPSAAGLRFDDRSALLERAMERHYDAVTGTVCADGKGLCTEFGHLKRGEELKEWLPALILNGTLVERGQGVVISDIDPASDFPDKASCNKHTKKEYPTHFAYPDAMPTVYDLYELLDVRRKGEKSADEKEIHDIRLSTALMVSARFPIISSRANIRAKVPVDLKKSSDEEAVLVGQVVDGGYFDNSGLSSIFDIVDALDCSNIDSIIINIRNAPLDDNVERLWRFPKRENPRQPLLEASDKKLDTGFSPLQALLNSSEGHVLDNRYSAIGRVKSVNYVSGNVYKAICLGVTDKDSNCSQTGLELQSLSMSWWLSAYAQGFLDIQDRDSIRQVPCKSYEDLHCRTEIVRDLKDALATTTSLPEEPVVVEPERTSQSSETSPSFEAGNGPPRFQGLDAVRPVAE